MSNSGRCLQLYPTLILIKIFLYFDSLFFLYTFSCSVVWYIQVWEHNISTVPPWFLLQLLFELESWPDLPR